MHSKTKLLILAIHLAIYSTDSCVTILPILNDALVEVYGANEVYMKYQL